MNRQTEAKANWLKENRIGVFYRPMIYVSPQGWLCSQAYIDESSLDHLKNAHSKLLWAKGLDEIEYAAQNKEEWIREIGLRKLKRPIKYHLGRWNMSIEYFTETPLEDIQARFDHADVYGEQSPITNYVIFDGLKKDQLFDFGYNI